MTTQRSDYGSVRKAEAECPKCGMQAITNEDILVRICRDNEALNHYIFWCPKCHMPTSRSMAGWQKDALLINGCRLQHWLMPREMKDPRPTGPKISVNDVIEFYRVIEATDDVLGLVIKEWPSQ